MENKLHPIMEQALKPWAPPPVTQCQYKAPACPKGMIEYACVHRGVAIICHLERIPAEIGARENGVQIEPDFAEHLDLFAVYVRGVNIYQLLDGVADEIEQAALKSIQGDMA